MKADEPAVPLVKYGMPASERHRIVQRHFEVLGEQRFIDAAQRHRSLVGLAQAKAALDRGKVGDAAAPEPVAAMPEPESDPADLRAMLGLG